MLEKITITDKIEILEDGTIQTRELTRIVEDGAVISQSYTNRQSIEPGEDVSKHGKRTRDISAIVQTPDVVTAFQTKKAAKLAEREARGKETGTNGQ